MGWGGPTPLAKPQELRFYVIPSRPHSPPPSTHPHPRVLQVIHEGQEGWDHLRRVRVKGRVRRRCGVWEEGGQHVCDIIVELLQHCRCRHVPIVAAGRVRVTARG